MNTSDQVAGKIDNGIRSASRTAESTVKSTADQARQVVSQVSDYADEFAESATAALGNVQQKATDALERAKGEGKRRMDQVEREVKDAPLAAIGIAFVGGLVLASLLKR